MGRIANFDLYYWDSCALVKRYAAERGTAEVDSIIDDTRNLCYISSFSIVEVHSALNKKVSKGRITLAQRALALIAFATDLKAGTFAQIQTTSQDVSQASLFAIYYGLTGGDALILATGWSNFSSRNNDVLWVTADQRQRTVVNRLGIHVYDPETSHLHMPSGQAQHAAPA